MTQPYIHLSGMRQLAVISRWHTCAVRGTTPLGMRAQQTGLTEWAWWWAPRTPQRCSEYARWPRRHGSCVPASVRRAATSRYFSTAVV
jgi:hypothetical protein